MADSKLEIRLKSKNKGGRPRGSRTCQPDVPLKPSKRMVDLMSSCYDDAEWQRRFKSLSISEQFRLRGGAEPKPKEETAGNTFRLIVSGIGNLPFAAECPQCKHRFMTSDPRTQQGPPGGTISTPATPEAIVSGGPRVYVPDEGALKRLVDRPDSSPTGDDWPDYGFPDV